MRLLLYIKILYLTLHKVSKIALGFCHQVKSSVCVHTNASISLVFSLQTCFSVCVFMGVCIKWIYVICIASIYGQLDIFTLIYEDCDYKELSAELNSLACCMINNICVCVCVFVEAVESVHLYSSMSKPRPCFYHHSIWSRHGVCVCFHFHL